MSPVFVTAPFLVQKALKTVNSEKFVFSCQTSKVVPEPPSSLVFRRNRFQTFSESCEFQPAELVTACHRSLFGCKSAQNPDFRGPTARQGPGSEPDSPPRWSVSPPSLSPLTSPLRPAPFFVQKALKTVESEESVFPCRTASGMPEPQASLVFGRKRAPDDHFQASAFGPENRRIPARRAYHRLSPLCHRFVTGPKSALGKFESIMEPGDSSMAHEWARLIHECPVAGGSRAPDQGYCRDSALTTETRKVSHGP